MHPENRDCDSRAHGDSCPLWLLMLNRPTQSRIGVRYTENKAYGDQCKQQTEASKGNKNTIQAGLRGATSERVAQTEGNMRFFNLFYPDPVRTRWGKGSRAGFAWRGTTEG